MNVEKEKLEKIIFNIAFVGATYALVMREGGLSPNRIAGMKVASGVDWPITGDETQQAIIRGATDAIKEIDRLSQLLEP